MVHSVTRATWEGADAPVAADLAPGRPLRPEAWVHLLSESGYEADVQTGPTDADYLVVAVRASVISPFQR